MAIFNSYVSLPEGIIKHVERYDDGNDISKYRKKLYDYMVS